MNVLYWNVCNEANPEQIRSEARALIEDESIDVACLQEVPYVASAVGPGQTTHLPLSLLLAEELGMEHAFAHTRTLQRSPTKIKGYGSAILSRAAVAEFQTHTLRDDRLAYMTHKPDNRRVLMTVRTADHPDIAINSAHLSYALPARIGSAGMHRERLKLCDILAEQQESLRVVFGGDLNTKPGQTLDTMLEGTGLRGVVDASQPTFRSRHWFAGHLKRNLDRVFVDPSLTAKAVIGPRRQSDHHPVVVEIDVN